MGKELIREFKRNMKTYSEEELLIIQGNTRVLVKRLSPGTVRQDAEYILRLIDEEFLARWEEKSFHQRRK